MATRNNTTTQIKRRIVVGLDGSESSKVALLWALELAYALTKKIEVVTVWEYPMMFGWEAGVFYQWTPEEDAEKVLQNTLKELFGADIPKEISTSIHRGNPTVALLDASKGADLLVVGSRGRGGFTGLLLGSVSAACAERAKCPVLVVHGNKP